MTQTTKQRSAADMIVGYFRDFRVLRETRREYWGIQIINVLDCTFYFAMLTIATLFLSTDLKMSDEDAGYAVALFTSATILMLTVSGALTDWLGIRKGLRVSMISMLILRGAVLYVGLTPSLPNRGLIASALLLLMAPFMAGIQTIYQASCQRFTTKHSRGAGFNLWYLFMNIGAAAGGYAVDFVRLRIKVGNVHIFTLGVICAVLCFVCGELMIRCEEQLRGSDEEPEAKKAKPEKKSPLKILVDVVRQPAFLRLMVLIALVLGVRAVYTYMYLLMPKYWERTIGPEAQIGVLNMMNPIGIVIGIILFIPLVGRFKVFNLLVYGSMFSAIALFPMAVPWRLYGPDISQSHYYMAILCMFLLTVGEVLWSPKLYEYTAAIAPEGREGTYLGFSMIPWFLAKTLVSAFSGHMLAHWSPEKVVVNGVAIPLQQALIQGQVPYWHSPAAMWLILGLYALTGCIVAALLQGWLTQGARWKKESATQAH
jgi:MFS family permease